MTPTPHQERTERELQTISKRTAVVSDAVDALAEVLSVDECADLVTAQIDSMLCSAVTPSGATRFWCKHLVEVAGNEGLRGAVEAIGGRGASHRTYPCASER